MVSRFNTIILPMGKKRITLAVEQCNIDPKKVIARFTAAFGGNFTDWLGKTTLFVKSVKAKLALQDNLMCESKEDHVGMLLGFAAQAGALPDKEDYAYVAEEADAIRRYFTVPEFAGLKGLLVLATLETHSLVFIPFLAELGKKCGCTDFTYTDVHGVADIGHSSELCAAVEAELKEGYRFDEQIMISVDIVVMKLLDKIFECESED